MKKIIFLSLILAALPTVTASAKVRSSDVNFVPDELIVKFRPEIADHLQKQAESGISANQMALPRGPDSMRAKYRVRGIRNRKMAAFSFESIPKNNMSALSKSQ